MPRKTKQQKILAELRALRSQVQTPINTALTEPKPVRDSISKERLSTLMSTNQVAATFNHDYRYVYKDLRKVAVLATIALLIEIVLSLTLNMGFAKLIPGLS